MRGDNDDEFQQFASKVYEKLLSYKDRLFSREVVIAAALDPRLKGRLSTFEIDREMVEKLLIDEFNLHYYEKDLQLASQRNECVYSVDTLPLLQSLIDENTAGDDFGVAPERFWSEVKRWFDTRDGIRLTQSKHADVSAWFRANKMVYPRIELMARDFLAIPATSVPSERAFSKAGCVVTERRARLGSESVSAICELESFLAFNKTNAEFDAQD
ncbi:hypothetical protein PINS_up004667 [Pythium insidiosum]|nr:hypothetical protein PINS_up004667 [Pythium insidiosum]